MQLSFTLELRGNGKEQNSSELRDNGKEQNSSRHKDLWIPNVIVCTFSVLFDAAIAFATAEYWNVSYESRAISSFEVIVDRCIRYAVCLLG